LVFKIDGQDFPAERGGEQKKRALPRPFLGQSEGEISPFLNSLLAFIL
jgi:hypothetical protein